MKKSRQAWTDAKVELIVSYLLRIGVTAAAIIVFVGGVLYLARYGHETPEYRIYSGESADLKSVSGIVGDLIALRSRGLMQFGLLLLMSTPVAWVAFLLFAFAKEGDRAYVVVALIVLCALLFSLAGRYI